MRRLLRATSRKPVVIARKATGERQPATKEDDRNAIV